MRRPLDLTDIQQYLDLWTGILDSRFLLEGLPVSVRSCCHNEMDLLAVHVESPLLADGSLRVRLAFPYASPDVDMADWTSDDRHRTECRIDGRRADLARTLDETRYHVRLGWSEGTFEPRRRPEFLLTGAKSDRLEFACLFSADPHRGELPGVTEALRASADHWRTFWGQGAPSTCPGAATRAGRRAGTPHRAVAVHHRPPLRRPMPSQETGLLFNSWYGKFHLEMHWWHAAHFALWDRFALLRAQPRLSTSGSCRVARETAAAGLRGRALAEDGRPRRARFAVARRAAADLAAAAPDLLRRAVLPRATDPVDAGAMARDRVRDRRVHGLLCAYLDAAAGVSCSVRR